MAVKADQVRYFVCVKFFFHWKMQLVKKVNFLLSSPSVGTHVVYIHS